MSILDQLTPEQFKDIMEQANSSQLRVLLQAEKDKVVALKVEVAKAAFIAGAYKFSQPWPNRDWAIDFAANEYANQLRQQANEGHK